MEPSINWVNPVTGTVRHNTQRPARYLVLTINWSTLERKGNTQEKGQHSGEMSTTLERKGNTQEKGQQHSRERATQSNA